MNHWRHYMRAVIPRKSLAALYVIVQHNIEQYEQVIGDPNMPRSAKLTSATLLNVPLFVERYNNFVTQHRVGATIPTSSLNAMGVVVDRVLTPLREAGLLQSANRRGDKFSPTMMGEMLVTDRLSHIQPAQWPLMMDFDTIRPAVPSLKQIQSLSLAR